MDPDFDDEMGLVTSGSESEMEQGASSSQQLMPPPWRCNADDDAFEDKADSKAEIRSEVASYVAGTSLRLFATLVFVPSRDEQGTFAFNLSDEAVA